MARRGLALVLAALLVAVPAAVGGEPRTEEERYRGEPGPRPLVGVTCELDRLNTNPVCFPVTDHDRGGHVTVDVDDDAHDLSVPNTAVFYDAALRQLAEHDFCSPAELPVPQTAAYLRVHVGQQSGPSICPTGVSSGTVQATFSGT